VIACYLQWLPSGLTWNSGRYLFILVPVVVIGLADALTAHERWRQLIGRGCLALAIFPTLCAVQQQRASYLHSLAVYRNNLIETVAWANAHIPRGAMVMIHDAGYVAYAGHFRLVDCVGLKTPQAVSINRALTFPSAGAKRSEALAEIAEMFQPQYLICLKGWNSTFALAASLRRAGWQVTKIFESAPSSNDAENYEVFALHKQRIAQSTQ
jgi:hypothetical protein